jgi:hypothetical protein
MSPFLASKDNVLNYTKTRSAPTLFSRLRVGLLAISVCIPNGAVAQAQTRSLPSHGKNKLDSYNYLLRDVHPASQAMANYLMNRLFLSGLKKAERLERQERIDTYDERQFIKKLQNCDSVAKRLSAGRPTSAINMPTFWLLVSIFGDRAEVYDALAIDVPPIAHEQFLPTVQFIETLTPDGELESLPRLLEGAERVDASPHQAAWTVLAKKMRANERPSAREVADFHARVGAYRNQASAAITKDNSLRGRGEAKRYLARLGSLAEAFYTPCQCAQVEQFVVSRGYGFEGGNVLELAQHMLRNRIVPAQGSTAQIALAELARPISRVLEQEIALHYERIDSLAAGEGYRPYASEYRVHDKPNYDAAAGGHVSQTEPMDDPGA